MNPFLTASIDSGEMENIGRGAGRSLPDLSQKVKKIWFNKRHSTSCGGASLRGSGFDVTGGKSHFDYVLVVDAFEGECHRKNVERYLDVARANFKKLEVCVAFSALGHGDLAKEVGGTVEAV